MSALEISAEVTPNPNTLKFNVSKALVESGSLNYTDKAKARESLLASKLFEIENVIGVMIGPNFVTITKLPVSQWPAIVPAVTEKLKNLLGSNEVLFPKQAKPADAPKASGESNSDIEERIKAILDNEIRPAVAMDGGDIIFYGYQDGVVTLHLQGS